MPSMLPIYPVVAFSPVGWTVQAENEPALGQASAWDDLGDWDGIELFGFEWQRSRQAPLSDLKRRFLDRDPQDRFEDAQDNHAKWIRRCL